MRTVLSLLLPERDRETVVGDLIEERRAKIAELGVVRAQGWYLLQVLSFVPRAAATAFSRHLVLVGICLFTALCGTWLGAMDLRLRHPGYLGQLGISLLIVVQAGMTLGMLVLPTRVLKALAVAGSAGIVWLAWKAFYGVTHDPHFEGYIVVIAFLLVVQAVLTWGALLRGHVGMRRA